MQEHGFYIYLFEEKASHKIIYVGRTRYPMRRFLEHRKDCKTSNIPLYTYMRKNNFELYRDINIIITEFITDEEMANTREQYYTQKFHDTVFNVHLGNDRSGKYSNRRKMIKCLTDGKVYDSIKEAKQVYPNLTNLSSHLQYGTRLKNGLVFQYVYGNNNNTSKVWKIKCLDDDKLFSSIKECAKYYGVSADILYHKGLDGNSFTVGTAGRGNKHCKQLNFIKFVN